MNSAVEYVCLGGMARTRDGGATWVPVGRDSAGPLTTLDVAAPTRTMCGPSAAVGAKPSSLLRLKNTILTTTHVGATRETV